MWRRLGLVSGGLIASACGTDTRPVDLVEPPTWYQDVAPIVARSCAGCHDEGGVGPFSLTTYDAAVEQAPRALHAIETGIMPPFFARDSAECAPPHPWRDDLRVSDAELATLRAWIDAGYPLGVETPLPSSPATELSDANLTLVPSVPFVTSGLRDQFVCVLLDPGNTELAWISGLQVRPGVPGVVHHVHIDQVVDPSSAQALVAAHGIGVPYREGCSINQPGQTLLHLWTPGSQALVTDGAELAAPLGPGAKLLVQLHYHPGGGVHPPDATAIDLRVSSQAPRRRYFQLPIGNDGAAPYLLPSDDEEPGAPPAFVIPANAPDHVERIRRPLAALDGVRNARLVSHSPHMHYIGTQITASIVRSDGTHQCVGDTDWNFDWQRTYTYDASLDALPVLTAGDRIEVACRYNNTTDNPGVLRMLNEAFRPPIPVDVRLGDDTVDEMCLETFGIAADVD